MQAGEAAENGLYGKVPMRVSKREGRFTTRAPREKVTEQGALPIGDQAVGKRGGEAVGWGKR